MEKFGALWSVGVASTLEALSRMTGKTIEETDVEPLTWALAEKGRQMSAPEYLLLWDWLYQFARSLAVFWESHDLLLTPTLAEPPPPLGTFHADRQNPLMAMARAAEFIPFTPAFNITGQPAISLPITKNGDQLPIGVQFVADRAGEGTLIRLASQLLGKGALPLAPARSRPRPVSS
jgi:amidase